MQVRHSMVALLSFVTFVLSQSVRSEEIPTIPTLTIVERFVETGYLRQTDRAIDTVVLHSAFAKNHPDPYDVEALLTLFRRYGVSAHYVIARDGTVYQLVRENHVSYHAGRSLMSDGRKSVNRFSLGIEIINSYEDSPTEAQYVSLELLLRSIRSRHTIRHVVAHKEVAPGRRSDPWNFDWERLKEK